MLRHRSVDEVQEASELLGAVAWRHVGDHLPGGDVERWFSELTTKWIKRSAHHSVRDLVASIRTWITNWNDDPKPYVWHKTADEILDNLANYCQRINDSGH